MNAICRRYQSPNDCSVKYTDEVMHLAENGMLSTRINGSTYSIDLWEPGKPVIQDDTLSLDTETHLIVKGEPLRPVLCQVASVELRMVQIAAWPHFFDYVDALLNANPVTTWVMHNGPFDIGACGLDKTKWLVQAINDGRYVDTGIRFILDSLARGIYYGVWGLDHMVKRFFGVTVPKDDEIRLGFEQDMTCALPNLMYAADDPIWTLESLQRMPERMPTEDIQLRGALALNDISKNGFMVDRQRMASLRKQHEEIMDNCRGTLENWGYRAGEEGCNKVLQYALGKFEEMYTVRFERTPKSGQIKTDKDMLVHFPKGMKIPKLVTALHEYKHSEKMHSTYLDEKILGTDGAVHPYFEPLVKTARTSCRGPNIQNLPRKGGLREIYVAREGKVLLATDLDQAELCALAQSCWNRFKESTLMELINSGVDAHLWFGERIAKRQGLDWNALTEDKQKWFRQYAKVGNFGFPGGLGPKTLQKSARGYGLELTIKQCSLLRELWLESFPEMAKHLKPQVDMWNQGMFVGSTVTGRTRRNATFCSACNYEFQGLVADGAKIALWYIYCAGYPMVNFIHDEVINELDEDDPMLQEKCRHIGELMCKGLKQVCPDVRVGAEGALMKRWYKEAEPIRDKEGNLLVWTPELAAKIKAEEKARKEREEKFDFDADRLEELIGGVSAD